MNDRIKRLARQAGMESEYIDDTEGVIWWLATKDLEKFAELIVRDCCKTMVDLEIKYPSNLVAKEIKTQYGLKDQKW